VIFTFSHTHIWNIPPHNTTLDCAVCRLQCQAGLCCGMPCSVWSSISSVAVRVSTQLSVDVATNGKQSRLLLQGKSSRSMTERMATPLYPLHQQQFNLNCRLNRRAWVQARIMLLKWAIQSSATIHPLLPSTCSLF
jgi:hypothetical protein